MLPAYILMVLMAALFGFLISKQSNDFQSGLASSREVDYATCLTGNDTRKVLADLLIAAGQGTVNADDTFSFTLLDLNTQRYLLEIEKVRASDSTLRDYIVHQLPQKDCTPLLKGEPAKIPTTTR